MKGNINTRSDIDDYDLILNYNLRRWGNSNDALISLMTTIAEMTIKLDNYERQASEETSSQAWPTDQAKPPQ